MRIGILTLPLHTNYGGILQAYALQTVLERMGHEVKVLNRDKSLRMNKCKFPVIITKRIVSKFILNRYKGPLLAERAVNKTRATIEQHTRRFTSRYIHNHFYRTIDDLSSFNADAIVVGSDQVWSPIHARNICGSVMNAYLPFTISKQMKRITYAASFGKDVWEYTTVETAKCRELIRQFDAVSVREESGILLCKDYLGVDAQCHLDPTLLLNAQDYVKQLAIEDVPQSKGDLLLYIIDKDENKVQVAEKIKTHKHLIPFEVNSRAEDSSGASFSVEECIQPSVEQWLRGFFDATFVVTDSFHACVFSILFCKPFVVVGNKERGMARFESMLSKVNLTSRLVDTAAQVDEELLTAPIDWVDVHNRLAILRAESLNYLKKNL